MFETNKGWKQRGKEVGADPGRLSFWVVAAGIVSKDLMSLCLGMMLCFVINVIFVKKKKKIPSAFYVQLRRTWNPPKIKIHIDLIFFFYKNSEQQIKRKQKYIFIQLLHRQVLRHNQSVCPSDFAIHNDYHSLNN